MSKQVISYCVPVCGFSTERVRLFESLLPTWTSEGIYPLVLIGRTKTTPWMAAERTWMMALQSSDSSHCCALQDDFSLRVGGARQIEELVARHPKCAVTFFQPGCGTESRLRLISRHTEDFALPDECIYWGGTLVLPRELVQPVVSLASKMDVFGGADDERMTAALRLMHIPVFCSATNIVQHEGAYLDSMSGVDVQYDKLTVGYRSGTLREQLARS